MIPELLDLKTGVRAFGEDMTVFWWTEGNGACDCNRAIAFPGVREKMQEEQHIERPDLKPHQGTCFGWKRFIAIGVRGNLEGNTERDIVRTMNAEYLV